MAIIAMTYVIERKGDPSYQLGCVYQLQIFFLFTIINFQINHAKILILCATSLLKIMPLIIGHIQIPLCGIQYFLKPNSNLAFLPSLTTWGQNITVCL